MKTSPDMAVNWVMNSPNNIEIVMESILFPSLDSYGDTRSDEPDV